MIVRVDEIDPEGTRFTGEEPASVLGLDAEPDLRCLGGVRYDLIARLGAGELIVRGRLGLAVSFRCSRCAEWFRGEVNEPGFECVREAPPGTETVDLTPDLREATLLAFPSHPVCRPACRGLCPQCGANWNRERCDCKPPADSRWGALDEWQPRR